MGPLDGLRSPRRAAGRPGGAHDVRCAVRVTPVGDVGLGAGRDEIIEGLAAGEGRIEAHDVLQRSDLGTNPIDVTGETRVEEQPRDADLVREVDRGARSEEHTSELQSLMRISYAVFCLKKKKPKKR